MSGLQRVGQAGTLESSDIMITIAPANTGAGVVLELTSPVMKQFGGQIKKVIRDTLTEYGIGEAIVEANDKGALDCTIRARVIAALERAMAKEV